LVGGGVEVPDGVAGCACHELQLLFALPEFFLHFAPFGDVDERGEPAGLTFDPEGGGINEDLFQGAGSGLESIFGAGGFGSVWRLGLVGPQSELLGGAADDLVARVLGEFLEGIVDLEEPFIFFGGDRERCRVVVEGPGEGSQFAVTIGLKEQPEPFLALAEFLACGAEGLLELGEGVEVALLSASVLQEQEGDYREAEGGGKPGRPACQKHCLLEWNGVCEVSGHAWWRVMVRACGGSRPRKQEDTVNLAGAVVMSFSRGRIGVTSSVSSGCICPVLPVVNKGSILDLGRLATTFEVRRLDA
jgi:hypothetical protein